MHFAILSSDANLVESFDQEDDARAALQAIVQLDPDSASEYAILTYDDSGQQVGDAIFASDPAVTA